MRSAGVWVLGAGVCAASWGCSGVRAVTYADGVVAGSDARHPWRACGPVAGTHQVATQVRCRDGTLPLRGDPARALDALVGETDGPDGHRVQFYDVACAEGRQRVYVDETCALPGRVVSALRYRITGAP
jgi:hypothetical protein